MSDINTLRAHLFDTLKALKDPNKPMEVDRARAVSEVAQTIINTAKVELEYLRHSGLKQSPFIPSGEVRQISTGTVTRDPAAGVTRHSME